MRALLAISGGFTVTLTELRLWPPLVVAALASASGVFVIIYLGCIAAYLRGGEASGRRLANAMLIPLLLASLVASGWRAIYPVLVLRAVTTHSAIRARRQPRHT